MKPGRKVDSGSKVHHYVPKYFIKGFTGSKGQLFVYDKSVRRYLGAKFPNQVLYELNGNTGYWGTQRNTIPEDSFRGVDTLQAPKIKAILSTPNDDVSEDLHGYLSHHMIMQYLRVPANLPLYEKLYRDMPTWSEAIPNRPTTMRFAPTDDTFRKLTRAFLPSALLRALLENDVGPWNSRMMVHNTSDYMVLTDNPVVYVDPPATPLDLIGPCMMALSSRRFYIRGELDKPIAPIDLMLVYNLQSMVQAKRWICASNLELLERMINAWLHAEKILH